MLFLAAVYLSHVCYGQPRFIVFPWPYLFARLTYWSAPRYLRALAARNERAFELLYETGVFVKWC